MKGASSWKQPTFSWGLIAVCTAAMTRVKALQCPVCFINELCPFPLLQDFVSLIWWPLIQADHRAAEIKNNFPYLFSILPLLHDSSGDISDWHSDRNWTFGGMKAKEYILSLQQLGGTQWPQWQQEYKEDLPVTGTGTQPMSSGLPEEGCCPIGLCLAKTCGTKSNLYRKQWY